MTLLFILYGCFVIPCLILCATLYRIGVLVERRKRYKEYLVVMQNRLDNDRKRPVSRHFQQRASKQLHRD